MNKNKTVSIWAPLRYANYGDDLQAIVFGKYIQSLGYDVKIFQLEESLANKYKFNVANTVEELCKNVNLCIIAGGALLTPFLLHKRYLNRSAAEYEKDFKDLNSAINKYNTKFCAISMGGDGVKRTPFLHYSHHRISFFKSPNFLDGTVRLEGDIAQMSKFGKKFKYIPDCLLQVRYYLELKVDKTFPPERPIRIGLNFKKGKYLDVKLIRELYKYAEKNPSMEFYFIKTHMDKTKLNYEYVPEKETQNIRVISYETPSQLLERLSGLDLLITSKLHLGITGLTLGIPYLSYRGPGKAKTFTMGLGGKWAVINDNITFDELINTYLFLPRPELFKKYNINKLNEMIEDSKKHYLFCKEILENYA